MNWIKHRTDRFVGRDFRRAERRPAIGGLAAFLKRALAGRNDPDCVKNNENADRPMSAIE
ncbi:MAG: hypothetical protein ABR863_11720 [Roseiarcus sp.]|jgi:hypothetical protein